MGYKPYINHIQPLYMVYIWFISHYICWDPFGMFAAISHGHDQSQRNLLLRCECAWGDNDVYIHKCI
jgi:hypothetical protein